jgi:hypothetical protein
VADQLRRSHQRAGCGARAAEAEAATAALFAPVGTAIFRAAFGRWAEQPERASLADRIRETATGLAASMQPADRRAGTTAAGRPS